jgi:hypothetical protein
MEKNWSWGHSNPETDREGDAETGHVTGEEPPAAQEGPGAPPEEERATGTVLPGHEADVRVAGTSGGRDDVMVPPAPDETGATGTPETEHVHDDTVAHGAPETNSGYRDVVEPGSTHREPTEPADVAAVAEPAEVTGDTPGTSQDVAGERPPASDTAKGDRIEQLMGQEEAVAFRARWREVQSDFVDDPEDAVRRADDLASEVLNALIESLNGHKRTLDDRWRTEKDDKSDTERLRQALRGYRDFLDRMLGA